MVMKTTTNDVSKHYKNGRCKREKFISEHLIDGDGYMVDGFIVDKGHRRGAEVHSITSNGIIIIHNLMSGKLITKLLARPSQIKRYYKSSGRQPPEEYRNILNLAELHKRLGYNKR